MDIANATAAGPSRGLLDVIFGSAPGPDEADADGKGFGNLMNLIKALNGKKDVEAQGGDISRTREETMLGKNVADSGVAGMPGMNVAAPNFQGDQLANADGVDLEKRERVRRLGELGMPAVALQADTVNQALREKGLPNLSPEETRLLQDVNGKLAQVRPEPAQGGTILPMPLAASGDPMSQVAQQAANSGQPPDPALQKAMAAKGLDVSKLKGAETSPGAAPEMMVPTETYLQMHESANAAGVVAKPQAKDLALKGAQPNGPDNPVAAKAESAITAGAVAATAEKGSGLGSRKGDEQAQLPEGAKRTKLDALAAGGFDGALTGKAEAMKHDVYLPGAEKPEQRASVLLAEVGSGVAFHAHKGGGEMRLVIHPDDLGEVKLKVGTRNGKVEVQVQAENDEVAKMIRGGAKELEASLRDQNLSLSKFEVTVSDASSVASTDTKSGFNEQFLGQNQQHNASGFGQGALGEDGRGARWSGDQGSRQGGGGGHVPFSETPRQSAGKTAAFVPKTSARSSLGAGRLDVVA